MRSYNLNLMALCSVSIIALLCSCYMCYINAISLDSDTQAIILSIICACCSLYGLIIAMSLDREDSSLLTIASHMDRLPTYNKRIITRSRSFDSIIP